MEHISSSFVIHLTEYSNGYFGDTEGIEGLASDILSNITFVVLLTSENLTGLFTKNRECLCNKAKRRTLHVLKRIEIVRERCGITKHR